MQKNLLLGLLCLLAFCSGIFSCAGSSIISGPINEKKLSDEELINLDASLEFSLVERRGVTYLSVTESFNMPRRYLGLKLPSVFMRKDNLYNRVLELTVRSNGVMKASEKAPYFRVLENKSNERAVFSYLLSPYDKNNSDKIKASFQAPQIRGDFFQFIGSMALVIPMVLRTGQKFPLKLKWNMPEDFKIYNSFGAHEREQKIYVSARELLDALFVGGKNIREYKFSIKGNPVYVVLDGHWTDISDEDFVSVLKKLLKVQRETWNDHDYPYFLVNITPMVRECSRRVRYAGTAHFNSFRAYFPSECSLTSDMVQLISHELVHMWIGKKIKFGNARGHVDGKWFTEGFADYYGRIFAHRAGIISEDQYFSTLNRQIEKYFTSPNRNTSLSEVVRRMYKKGLTSPSLENLPYQQGEIVALRLNSEIKEKSQFQKSLDDVFREMLGQAKNENRSKKFSFNEISSIVDQYAPGQLNVEYEKIKRGSLIVPPKMDDCRPFMMSNRTRGNFFVNSSIAYYGRSIKSCQHWLFE